MKYVFITGATRNTGWAIAQRFAREGYGVAVTSRHQQDALDAAVRLRQEFPAVQTLGLGMHTDSVSSIRAAFAQVKAAWGRLDVFVSNAAHLAVDMSIFNSSEEDWDAVINANAKGAFFGCQEAVKLMDRGGAICMISSVHAHACIPGRVLYTTSKGAINAMARSLAIELGHLNIRVNTLTAGAIHSERWDNQPPEVTVARRAQYPAGRESFPEEIANGVYYLCSDQAPTVTGTELTIDSGILDCLLPYKKGWNQK